MLWIQGFHVIFVVCWFAGIFYLPRILVYYAQSPEPETKAVLAVMARKLYRFVTPFMVLAIALGLWRLSYQLDYYLSSGWMIAKLCGVCVWWPIIFRPASTSAASVVVKTIGPTCFIGSSMKSPFYSCLRSYCWSIYAPRSEDSLHGCAQPRSLR